MKVCTTCASTYLATCHEVRVITWCNNYGTVSIGIDSKVTIYGIGRDTKERGLETKFLRNFCVKHSAL